MADIVERLRDEHNQSDDWCRVRCLEAADEIERLRALLKEAADDLTICIAEFHPSRHEYPDEMRRYNRDMDLPNRIRELLNHD